MFLGECLGLLVKNKSQNRTTPKLPLRENVLITDDITKRMNYLLAKVI